jgi:hypothetical protein
MCFCRWLYDFLGGYMISGRYRFPWWLYGFLGGYMGFHGGFTGIRGRCMDLLGAYW